MISYILHATIDHEKGTGTPKDRELDILTEKYPELSGCHRGTINLQVKNSSIEPKLIKIDMWANTRPDLETPLNANRYELTRIDFEFPVGKELVTGWIYQPFGSYWEKGRRDFIEVILANKIVKPNPSDPIYIHIKNSGIGEESLMAPAILKQLQNFT